MAPVSPSLFAFTTKYNGRSNKLENKIYLAEAFDPRDKLIKPQWLEFKCLWDTGASNSAITEKVVNNLELKPTGRVTCHTAGGDRDVNTYLVNIELPNKLKVPYLKVTEGIIYESYDVLIGMDIISRGDLAITNKDGITWMSYQFPSNERIDFVSEINRKKGIPDKQIKSANQKRKARNIRKRKERNKKRRKTK